jgi:putative sigma-54 modulation protein
VDLHVVGKHVEVPAALKESVAHKITRIERFAKDVRRVDVDFGEVASRRADERQTCEVLVHLRKHLVKGEGSAVDHAIALDRALEKVEHQLRRLHGRRADKRTSRRDGGPGRAARDGKLVVEPPATPEPEGPVIVRNKQFALKPMDPEEAALQMELLGHDFFVFTVASSQSTAVVYRRRDGNFGLIESE